MGRHPESSVPNQLHQQLREFWVPNTSQHMSAVAWITLAYMAFTTAILAIALLYFIRCRTRDLKALVTMVVLWAIGNTTVGLAVHDNGVYCGYALGFFSDIFDAGKPHMLPQVEEIRGNCRRAKGFRSVAALAVMAVSGCLLAHLILRKPALSTIRKPDRAAAK